MGKSLKSKAIIVSEISIAANLLLTIVKLLAGYKGHSQALIADAIHSASDVLSTLIVIVSLVISSRKADANHEYGHQKFESVAALVLAIMLGQLGIKIGFDAVRSIADGSYMNVELPSMVAAYAAVLSIIVKELMYQITIAVAKKESSNALKADAWHHRSDALSSIGSLVGVLFAINGLPVMDRVASVIICVFILKTAFDIAIDAIKELTDSACDERLASQIREDILNDEDVLGIDVMRTRIFGNGIYMDVEIQLDSEVSFVEAHRISERVHDRVEERFPKVWHCMVHANPVDVKSIIKKETN